MHLRPYRALPLAQVQGIGLGQPRMSVDARALVKPAVAEAGVHARHNAVFGSIVQKIRHVEPERHVPVVVAPDKAAVHKNHHIAEGAVELDRHAPPQVAGRNLELAPVPSHAGLRVAAAKRLVSVRHQLVVVHKWQFHSPVVRQVQTAPFRVVESGLCKFEPPGLVEIPLPVAKAQVTGRIAAVAKQELPAEVEEQLLPRRNRRQRPGCCGPGIAAQKSRRAPPGQACHQRGCGKCRSRTEQVATGYASHESPLS